MMICEKCEKEMQGSAVHCSHCGHNHVLQRIDAWRERRNQMNARHHDTPPDRATPLSSIQQARAQAKDSTLIRFPKRPQSIAETPPPPPPVPNVESLPEWRHRLDVRLKEIREQKAMEAEPPRPKSSPTAEPELDRNPKIAAALNRIQRVSYLDPITPPPRSRYAVAAELSPEPRHEEAPVLASPPVSRLTEAKTTTIIPIRPQPVLEAFADPELPMAETLTAETAEDLLAEVIAAPSPKAEEKTAGITILEAASLPQRAAAAAIDAEIIIFSLLPLVAVYVFLGGGWETPTIYLPVTFGLALIALYFFLTYALAGRTMGMAFMNLFLASQSANAEPVSQTGPTTVTFTFQQAAWRALGSTISLLLFPVNMFWIVRNYDRLSLSDSLSGTQVIKIKK